MAGRGRVVDVSLTAWKRGIAPGQVPRHLRSLYPDLRIVEYVESGSFPRLHRARDVLYRHSPVVEPDGLNAFVRTDPDEVTAIGAELQAAGAFLTVAGAAGTRILARAAALDAYRQAKAGRETGTVMIVISPARASFFLRQLTVRRLWFLPPAVRSDVFRAGLRTLGDVSSVPASELRDRFGKWGSLLARVARGEDIPAAGPPYPPPSLQAKIEFETPAEDAGRLRRGLEILAGQLADGLSACNRACSRLLLVLEGDNGESLSTEKVLCPPRATRGSLYPALASLAGRMGGIRPAALVSVAHDLVPVTPQQLSLLEEPAGARSRLLPVLETLARRYGKPVVRRGCDHPPNWTEEMLAFWDPLRRGIVPSEERPGKPLEGFPEGVV